jgi:hypothetical protein
MTSAYLPTSPSSRALALYRECVDVGLCARLVVETKPDGERIFFSSRPAARAAEAAKAAPAAKPAVTERQARISRPPNLKRIERNRRRNEARKQRRLAAVAAEAAEVSVPAAEPHAAGESATGTPAAVSTAAAVVLRAATAATSTATAGTPARMPLLSPIQTRAKKRRLASQLSPLHIDDIPQLDGAESPPSSPPSPPTRHLPALTYVPAEPPLHSPPRERRVEIEGREAAQAGQSRAAVVTPQPLPQPPPQRPPPPVQQPSSRGAATYAAVAAQGASSFPPIQLTRPSNGACEAIFRPDGERCNDCPAYNTNYGRYCEECIRGHFLNYKHTDLYIF